MLSIIVNFYTYHSSLYFQIKNNSMKKLAATTLMEILPEEMQNMVEMIFISYLPKDFKEQ